MLRRGGAGARLAAGLLILAATASCIVRLPRLGVTDAASRAALRGWRISFARRDGLYLARGDGSDPRRLLRSEDLGRGAAVFMPAMSRDGRRVLFLSLGDLNVLDSTGRDLALNLLTLDGARLVRWHRIRLDRLAAPGSGRRQTVFTVAAAAWSRDGRRIAVGLNRPASAGGDAVVIFDAGGRPTALHPLGERTLPPVTTLSWTPDGASLIVGLEAEGQAPAAGVVARLDVSVTAGVPSLSEIAPGRYPSVSPDGRLIAVVDPREGARDLVLLDLEGGEIERFVRPAGRALNRLYWSADGRYLYYYSLASTGPLGLIETTMLRCLEIRSRRVFDLVRLG